MTTRVGDDLCVQTRVVVVAAGHKHIPAPKSGGSYPAFLISNDVSVDADTLTSNSSSASGPPARWRTKRDLLLLSRSAKATISVANSTSKTTKKGLGSFPKSTFCKLSDAAASCPWIRPDVEFSPHVQLLEELHPQQDVRKGWRPEMFKSVRRLDEFLKECLDLYEFALANKPGGKDAEAEQPILRGWRDFCRPTDADGLIDYNSVPCDAGQVIEYDDSSKRRVLDKNITSLSADPTKRAASLGQYFASDDNAAAVVDAAVTLAGICGDDGNYMEDLQSIVFVEPSCGDGRVLECLLKRCLNMGISTCTVLAYDIDDVAIEACEERIRSSFDDEASKLPPRAIQQADFLSLSKDGLSRDIAGAQKGREDYMCVNKNNYRVVFLGGPPYSLGPLVNGREPERGLDLPQQFLRQCLIDLEGDAVSFLLPERSERDANALQKDLPDCWKCTTNSVKESSFDFLGKSVSQPSILQCWHRK